MKIQYFLALIVSSLLLLNAKCGGNNDSPSQGQTRSVKLSLIDKLSGPDPILQPQINSNQGLISKILFNDNVDVSSKVKYIYFRKAFGASQYYSVDIYLNQIESSGSFSEKYDYKLVVSRDSSIDNSDEYFTVRNVAPVTNTSQNYISLTYDTSSLRIDGIPFKRADVSDPNKLKWYLGMVIKSKSANTGHLWAGRVLYTNSMDSQSETQGAGIQPAYSAGR